MTDRVLVTGATGFIARHCLLQLVEAGFVVRGTARTAARASELAGTLAPHLSAVAKERLASGFEVVVADLLSDDGWDDAAAGCRYVLHVASPLPRRPPRRDDELIVPARDGTLRVLHAAQRAGVERVVLTSSVAAIVYGHPRDRTFDESDWTDLSGPRVGAYERSKTIAERAAWDFVHNLGPGAGMEMVAINPGAVLGPLLSADWGTSAEMVKQLIDRTVPAIPDISLAMVDVRDVAWAHVAAMTSPAANGLRLICAIESHSLLEIATILRAHLADRGFRITTRTLPSSALRIVALVNRTARLALNDLGTTQDLDSRRIRTVLGWTPRDLTEMTTSMADSLIEYGAVRRSH